MICKLCESPNLDLADAGVFDYEYESPGNYDYFCCRQCGLFNIDPIPDENQLRAAYPDSYHAFHTHTFPLARFLKSRFWKRKARRYSHYAGLDSNLLEIGCAFGDLLKEFKNLGFTHLKGLDYNLESVERAHKTGLDVVQGELQNQFSSGENFQLIIMENFIEHVHDPLNTLKYCNSLLRNGGFVVGETPNVDSLDYKLFRKHWGGYHSPRHLYLFNKDNLKILAEKAGFRVRRISNLLQPAHWVLSIQNRIQDSPWKTRLRNGRSFYFPWLILGALPLNFLQWLTSQTSSVEFIFEKTGAE